MGSLIGMSFVCCLRTSQSSDCNKNEEESNTAASTTTRAVQLFVDVVAVVDAVTPWTHLAYSLLRILPFSSSITPTSILWASLCILVSLPEVFLDPTDIGHESKLLTSYRVRASSVQEYPAQLRAMRLSQWWDQFSQPSWCSTWRCRIHRSPFVFTVTLAP